MMVRVAEAIRIYLSNNRHVDVVLPRTDEAWTQLGDPSSVIMRNNQDADSDAVHWTQPGQRRKLEGTLVWQDSNPPPPTLLPDHVPLS
eukprot:CAMPEP_0170203574 /NCGR_PEP_ID=MMETSP0116_2-20130129/1297_1 /TAXON_ID=400756 /ORGANISM="Durinskia baltica, Strain CSIRO CS-38" /LENGTH=87 /DNA_ID=CAMNT_0010453897 /DNA_START=129 /DNA_END=392 /DNA_ORIENTATION=-